MRRRSSGDCLKSDRSTEAVMFILSPTERSFEKSVGEEKNFMAETFLPSFFRKESSKCSLFLPNIFISSISRFSKRNWGLGLDSPKGDIFSRCLHVSQVTSSKEPSQSTETFCFSDFSVFSLP